MIVIDAVVFVIEAIIGAVTAINAYNNDAVVIAYSDDVIIIILFVAINAVIIISVIAVAVIVVFLFLFQHRHVVEDCLVLVPYFLYFVGIPHLCHCIVVLKTIKAKLKIIQINEHLYRIFNFSLDYKFCDFIANAPFIFTLMLF